MLGYAINRLLWYFSLDIQSKESDKKNKKLKETKAKNKLSELIRLNFLYNYFRIRIHSQKYEKCKKSYCLD